jgi:hypothetical protein
MKTALPFFATLVLCSPVSALPPGVPDPGMSIIALSPPGAPCQYVFRADGTMDVLTVTVTALDVAGVPVVGCPVTVTVVPVGPPTIALCVCAPCNPAVAVTDVFGVAAVDFVKIGGRGLLGLTVEACGIALGGEVIRFTSPDLSGSCDPVPPGSTSVVDFGIWAGGLPPGYLLEADYDCSDFPVDVVDLGIFAGGLGDGCDGLCP